MPSVSLGWRGAQPKQKGVPLGHDFRVGWQAGNLQRIPARAYENDRGFRRLVFYVRISCMLRLSLKTRVNEVAASKYREKQPDQ